MCNLPTNFLQTCRGSTNLAIHRKLAKIIDNSSVWLGYEFFELLAKFFIFSMSTHLLAKSFRCLEMLLHQEKTSWTRIFSLKRSTLFVFIIIFTQIYLSTYIYNSPTRSCQASLLSK